MDESICVIPRAGSIGNTAGRGTLVYQDSIHLHGPLDLAVAPNGQLLVANSDGQNADPNQPGELVEFTIGGKFLSEYSLDPNNGGAFGLAIHAVGLGSRSCQRFAQAVFFKAPPLTAFPRASGVPIRSR